MRKREQQTDRQTVLRLLLTRLGISMLAMVTGLGLCYGLWRLVASLPVGLLAAWALIATASIPVVAWLSWYFGHTEVRGWLSGMDKAIDKMMGTATEVATLRGQIRKAEVPPPPEIRLPEIIEVRPRLSGGHEVIDL